MMMGKSQLISTEARRSGRILAKDKTFLRNMSHGQSHVVVMLGGLYAIVFLFFFKCLAAVSPWR